MLPDCRAFCCILGVEYHNFGWRCGGLFGSKLMRSTNSDELNDAVDGGSEPNEETYRVDYEQDPVFDYIML